MGRKQEDGQKEKKTSRIRQVAKVVKDKTEAAANQVVETYEAGLDTTTSTVSSGFQTASQIAGKGAEEIFAGARQVGVASSNSWQATVSLADDLMGIPQSILARGLENDITTVLQDLATESAAKTRYKADEYLAGVREAGYRGAFDQAVNLAGVIVAARSAAPDDTLVQEALEAVQGLFGDSSFVMELPFAESGKEIYEQTADTLQGKFHIPKDWFYNLDVYDNTELLFGAIDVVSLALHWDSEETETFAKIAGRLGVWASLSGNPALVLVTVVALAKAFHQAHQTGEYAEFVDGQLKGSLGAGATLAAVAVVGVAGGPAGVALLAGMAAGILAQKAAKDVSVVEISKFLTEQTVDLAIEVKALTFPETQAYRAATSGEADSNE